jgi:hypothetical protein
MGNFETIELEISELCAILRLNRPDRLNSFNAQMHEEVKLALGLIEAGQEDRTIRSLLLTGTGRGFCAGQDLSDRNVAANENAPDLGESIDNWTSMYQDCCPPGLAERVNGDDGKKLFPNLSINDLQGYYTAYMNPDILSGSKTMKKTIAILEGGDGSQMRRKVMFQIENDCVRQM